MLKFTRNSVIAFDFKDALSFEGETGPYVQYAVVRAAQHLPQRRHHSRGRAARSSQALDAGAVSRWATRAEDIWALWLRAGRRTLVLEQCIATSEPAYLAKHAFQLAQEFNNFYHKHHILTEEDHEREDVPARYRRRSAAGTDNGAWLARHREPGSHVVPT